MSSASSTEGQPDTIIFLDIDGVLHSLYGEDLFRETCVGHLEHIVRSTGAAIVLSSAWRTKARSTAMIEALLKQRKLGSLYDCTKDLGAGRRQAVPRELEICEWLDRQNYTGRWIAIDDMNLLGASKHGARMRGHFVKTNSNCGLTSLNVELALRLLSQQGQPAPSSPSARPPGGPGLAPKTALKVLRG